MEQLSAESMDGWRTTVEQFKDLILSSEEYREHLFATSEHERTHVFELTRGDVKLVYFGTSHTNNPDDPIFEDIQKIFRALQPDMVYVEGQEYINDKKESVRKHMQEVSVAESKVQGEHRFTLHLATESGADFESPEPNPQAEITDLLGEGFSREDIFRFYIYRGIDQYQRHHDSRSADECIEYLKGHVQRFEEDSRWESGEISEFFERVSRDLDVGDMKKYHEQVDPIPWEHSPETVINLISRRSSLFRDLHIFERIASGLKTHKRIFVVYGATHAVKQEPAFRALMGNANKSI